MNENKKFIYVIALVWPRAKITAPPEFLDVLTCHGEGTDAQTAPYFTSSFRCR